jgi:hypothetical protein
MAARKTLVKMNHIEALYKFVNDVDSPASLTIDIDVDLLKSNETLSGSPVKVAISNIDSSIAITKEVNIVRNSVVIMNLFENTNMMPFLYGADKENETHDITVNFTGKGTVYMRLIKEDGFKPNFRPEQGVNV